MLFDFTKLADPKSPKSKSSKSARPAPQEIRVRVEAIGLNRAESAFRAGAYLEQPNLPARLGYEASVMIEALDSGVKGFQVGEAVSVIPTFSMNAYGVYGEQAIGPATAVVKRPSHTIELDSKSGETNDTSKIQDEY